MLPHTPRRPHSVIPPYMLEHIAAHADEPLRVRARQTLQQVRAVMAEPSRKTDAPGVRAMTALAPLHVPGVVQRAIYNAKHLAKLPGSLVRSEGQAPIGNRASDEAYTYLGATYDFFWEVFGRDSLDNQGLPLVASVHYEVDYQNAFWDGKQMVFGDGDGKIFNRFTIALDIVAHELSHGITESEAGLIYTEQSGALNESMSDVFGSLVKQHYLQQTADQADWIIGAGLLVKGINGKGLRSMSAPGTAYDDPLLGRDPQPASMAGFISAQPDNGGVHINSGIPNRAFYLAATALGGFAWETAGKVWYDTLLDQRLSRTAKFADFAKLTVVNGKARLGQKAAAQIKTAWKTVGVL
jgi:Zn-dependent metalloprotease